MHILIIGGISRSLINFRGPLIRAMRANGHTVSACAGKARADVAGTLESWGVQFFSVNLSRTGMNPFGDLKTCRGLYRIMRQECPDVVLAYTIKPVIWGGIAARFAHIPNVYSLITGLGYAFMANQAVGSDQEKRRHTPSANRLPATATVQQALKQRLAGWIAHRLYKASLKHSSKVFFQNPDDRHEFVQLGLVDEAKGIVVSGSGVDLSHFCREPLPHLSNANRQPPTISFLLIARLLRDKGIGEYAEAAAIIKRNYPGVEFHLVGACDPNPAGLKLADIDRWAKSGAIIYHGQQSDVRPFLRDCAVYVLPSYREGTPRTVLEAMATGRAIITTDAPGCRETVRRGKLAVGSGQWAVGGGIGQQPTLFSLGANGILIPPRDAGALAEAMRYFLDNPEQIAIMGRESHRYAEERYDVHKVNATMLEAMGL